MRARSGGIEVAFANTRDAALLWWAGKSVAMGIGIWSMHFVGMLEFTLPIQLGDTGGMTLLSWLAAVGVSGIALGMAGRGGFRLRRLVGSAIAMQDLETGLDAQAVVDAVIRLAQALDLSVVAEGVETHGQCDTLLSLACDELQGYFFVHPMPASQLMG